MDPRRNSYSWFKNGFKRVMALLLCAAILLGLVAPCFAAEEVVKIDSAEALLAFSAKCIDDSYSAQLSFALTADIDLGGRNFKPIPIFSGSFDGKGHTISGFLVEGKSSSTGLFRHISATGSVRNLTVQGSVCPEEDAIEIGILAGKNEGLIENCVIYGNAAGKESIGGAVGINLERGQIKGTVNKAHIKGKKNTGGIAGKNEGSITFCTNEGLINNHNEETYIDTGGIAGWSSGKIQGATNKGEIGYAHNGYNTGGVTGLSGGNIINCANTGAVYGRKDVGGITGQLDPSVSMEYGEKALQRVLDEISPISDLLKEVSNALTDGTKQGVDDFSDFGDRLRDLMDIITDSSRSGIDRTTVFSNDLYDEMLLMNEDVDDLLEYVDDFSMGATKEIAEITDFTALIRKRLETGMNDVDSEIRDHGAEINHSMDSISNEITDIRAAADDIHDELDETSEKIEDVGFSLDTQDYHNSWYFPLNRSFVSISAEMQSIQEIIDEIHRGIEELRYLVNEARWVVKDTATDLREKKRQLGEIADAIEEIDIEKQLDSMEHSMDIIQKESDAIRAQATDMYTGASDAMLETAAKVNEYADQINLSVNRLNNEARTLVALSTVTLSEMNGALKESMTLVNNYVQDSGTELSDTLDALDAEADRAGDAMERVGDTVRDTADALDEKTEALFDQIDRVVDEAEAMEEPEFNIDDAANEKYIEGASGQIVLSSNAGNIEGDTCVAGIAGNVAREFYDDPEEDLAPEELLVDTTAYIRAVIIESKNTGNVTAKLDYAGGILGQSRHGIAAGCINTGNIETTEGSYCGGIAGKSENSIERCYSMTTLSGYGYLGGIAGLGKDMNRNYAMTLVSGESEKVGAIAGDLMDEAEVYSNYFVREEIGGIDNANISGVAMSMSYEQFTALPGIPEEFKHFRISFADGDKTIATIPVRYGATIRTEDIPKVPEREGLSGQWMDFDAENIRRPQVVAPEYVEEKTVLTSEEAPPFLLVEGHFSPDAALNLREFELAPDTLTLPAHYEAVSGYYYTIEGSSAATAGQSLRIRPQNARQTIGVIDGTEVTVAQCQKNGSYLVLDAPENQRFVLLEKKQLSKRILGASTGAGTLGAAALVGMRRKRSGAL